MERGILKFKNNYSHKNHYFSGMKKLFFTILILVIYSCGFSEEQVKEQENLLTKQYEFAINDATIYRNQIEIYRLENSINNFLSKQYPIITKLDSTQKSFAKKVDELRNKEKINYAELKQLYIKSVELYQMAFDSLEHRPEKDENIITFNTEVLEKNTSEKLIICQMKTTLTMSYANYLKNVYYYLDDVAFTLYSTELSTNHKIDTTGKIIINLRSESMQKYSEGRNLIVESIKKDGKEVEIDYNVISNYSFSDLIIPTKGDGNYFVKGKVVYYTKKGRKEYPFQEEIKVK